jgi:hypothetical protein
MQEIINATLLSRMVDGVGVTCLKMMDIKNDLLFMNYQWGIDYENV